MRGKYKAGRKTVSALSQGTNLQVMFKDHETRNARNSNDANEF